MIKKKIEILSPAGSLDCIQAAVQAGADAVYFGVEQLNMRARSTHSFKINDMKEVSTLCKANGIKTYLTLNTEIYDHDMQLMRGILKEVLKNNIDAVIASDFAVISYCSDLNIPLHISTQANVCNLESVRLYSKYADVVVLARELTLSQIKQITSEIKRQGILGVSGELMKVEVFVHGSLCMAISGKCYLSLHRHNASANRGACFQNCRHLYKVINCETNEELSIDNKYIMSSKDLCTIDILDQIAHSGVDILKIEGRTKGADYIYSVTKCYKEALQSIDEGTFSYDKIENWKTELAKVYNRGFWEGHYLGQMTGQWTSHYGSIATEKKIYIGKGSNYFSKMKVGEFIVEAGKINVFDTIMVIGPICGVQRLQMLKLVVNGVEASEATKGDKVTFPFATKISANDKLYKICKNRDV